MHDNLGTAWLTLLYTCVVKCFASCWFMELMVCLVPVQWLVVASRQILHWRWRWDTDSPGWLVYCVNREDIRVWSGDKFSFLVRRVSRVLFLIGQCSCSKARAGVERHRWKDARPPMEPPDASCPQRQDLQRGSDGAEKPLWVNCLPCWAFQVPSARPDTRIDSGWVRSGTVDLVSAQLGQNRWWNCPPPLTILVPPFKL